MSETKIPGAVYPSGAGSAILNAWKAQQEAQRGMGAVGWQRAGGGPVLTGGRGNRALRGYMAASNDRLVADLMSVAGFVSGNAEVRMGLRTMRMRSRQLANDNEYVKRFLQLVRNNVTGPNGFSLQMKVKKSRGGQLDEDANDVIEEAYERMSKLGTFTACGKLSRGMFERAVITGMARDGEVVIEKLYGRQFNEFGIAWRLIDPDLLDETLNIGRNGTYPGSGRLEEGHSIRMGVEVNAYGRPVAYWFHNAHPGDDVVSVSTLRHRRVEADRILHCFLAEEQRPETVRGVPWIYAALRRMAMLGGYEEAALVSSRQGASKMGFYKRPANEPTPMGHAPDGTPVATDQDAEGNLIEEAEPGVFGVLPAGWDFTTYDPAYPNDKMEAFVKAMLRAFSSGVGLTYNTMASDLEGVSLSAMRHGANQDRDTYEALQQFFRTAIGVPMFEPWLRLSLDMGRVGRLPPEGFDRFNKPRLIARPFRSPDPQKDVAAQAQAVALGVRSRTRICAENGDDFNEILDELAEEEALAKQKGVTLNTAAATAHKTPAVDDAGKPAKPGAEGGTQPEDDEEGADDADGNSKPAED